MQNWCTVNIRSVGPVTDGFHGFRAQTGIKHGTCQSPKKRSEASVLQLMPPNLISDLFLWLTGAMCHKWRRVKFGSICQHQRAPLWHRRLCLTSPPPLPNTTTSGKVSPDQRLLRLLSESVAVMLSKHIPASVQRVHYSPLGTQESHTWLQAPPPLQSCSLCILTISII